MVKKLISLFILTLFLVSVLAVAAIAKSQIKDVRSEKLSQYSFMFHKKVMGVRGDETPITNKSDIRQSLGIAGDGNSPGAVIAHTWYEWQQNSSYGRGIDWRAPNPQVHMAYTQMFAAGGRRFASYNVYDPASGTWPKGADVGCPVSPPQGAASGRAGFATVDVRDDGGAVIACHHSISEDGILEPFYTTVYVDATASIGVYCGFGNGSHAPNEPESAAMEPPPAYIWPKLEYHVNGNDTVIYAFSCESVDNADLETLVLFRNAGSSLQSTWEYFVIDTAFFMVQDITASRVSSKVALCWLEEAEEGVEGNNDVWYWVSDDMGATWDPADKTNVTQYQEDEEGYRAWLELSCLYDSNDHLHIIWNANLYDGTGGGAQGRSCRLFHWAEHTDVISTVQNAEWDPLDVCGVGGSNVLNVAKFTVSECNGRIYVIWVQFGDPENGDSTDCADPDFVGVGDNANGEIYMSVSTTLNGTLWDAARNLTNTKSPNCDTTAGNECDNEMWPTMSRYGMDTSAWTGLDWTSAAEALQVDPSANPPYTGTYFLDVMYVNDLVPGASEMINIQGTMTANWNCPIKWFRLPCVDPVIEAKINLSPRNIYYPEYTQHGDFKDYNIKVENSGNADLNITEIYIEKETETGLDWLGIDQTTMLVPSGAPDNIDTLEVTLNKGGVINTPGTVVNLEGSVAFVWERQVGLDTTFLPIDFFVADTVVGIVWDTISTNFIDLIVSSNGNMGNSNIGFVNMDFANTALECDDSSNYREGTTDTIPGDASVYLGNASPVILTGSVVGVDTTVTASWAIFKETLDEPNGFRPVTGPLVFGADIIDLSKPTHYESTEAPFYDCFHTGAFVTIDSTLVIDKTYYAPKDDVSYIIQMMRIFSFDGDAHSGLIIGEAYDWDIPSDTGSYNSSGIDGVTDLIYMLGSEFNEARGDSLECTDNDTRAAGAVRAGYYTQAEYNSNPTLVHTDPIWGGYSELNEDYVYPANGFIPNELYGNMLNNSGLNAQASSVSEDLHIVLTHFDNYSLGATDTLIIWTVMATTPPTLAKDAVADLVTEIDAGKAWLDANITDLKKEFLGCCIGETGNVDCSLIEEPDISDIVRLIDYLYLSHAPLCCYGEANVDGSGVDPGSEEPDISDITYLIDHLYLSHKDLKRCPFGGRPGPDPLEPPFGIVLTWEAVYPDPGVSTSDMDLHLDRYPAPVNPENYEHCYYNNMVISGASLDYDERYGWGPETITITELHAGEYLFRVNCYELNSDFLVKAYVKWVKNGITVFTWGPYPFSVQDMNGENPDAWWDVVTFVIPSSGDAPYITGVREDRVKLIEKSALEMIPKK